MRIHVFLPLFFLYVNWVWIRFGVRTETKIFKFQAAIIWLYAIEPVFFEHIDHV